MRTNSVLATAQDASAYTAYVTALTNATPLTNILEVSHTEEPYGASAMIRINNYDGTADALALKGSTITLGWGIGAVASTAAVLWCYAQQFVSAPGRDEFTIYAEGAWDKLARFTPGTGDDDGVAYYFNSTAGTPAYANYSIKDILSFIGTAAGVTMSTAAAWDDGKIDAFEPAYQMGANTDGRSAIRTLLAYTKCVLIPSGSGLAIKYPAAGDATDSTYNSAAGHYFRRGSTRTVYAKPLKVVVSNESYSGSATATGWTSAMGYLSYVDDCAAGTSNADCDFMAAAILSKVTQEEDTGYLVTQMNPLQEVYDKVIVTDARGNISSTGRVGIITRHFKAGSPESRAIYDSEITLGGLQKNPNGPIQPLSSALVGDSWHDLKDIPTSLPWTVQPDDLLKAMQPYTNTLAWSSTGTAVAINSGGSIYFADGGTQAIGAGTKSDLTTTHFAYFITGNSTVQWTTDAHDTVGSTVGLLAVAVVGSTASIKALILPSNAKEPVLNANLLYADIILGTYIKAGEIDTDHLAAESVTFSKLQGTPANCLADSGFELSEDGAVWVGWEEVTGTGWNVYKDTSSHGGLIDGAYIRVAGNATASEISSSPIKTLRCEYGDIITGSAWVATFGDPGVNLVLGLVWRDVSGVMVGSPETLTITTGSGLAWAQQTLTKKAPTGTVYVSMYFYYAGGGTGSTYWYVDDCALGKASQIIVQGTPGGTRTEITADHVAGYNGTVLQWEGKSSDGKLYAAGGSIVMDAEALKLYGDEILAAYYGTVKMGYLAPGNGQLIVNASTILRLLATGPVQMTSNLCFFNGLPTSDPGVAGQIWRSGTVVYYSTG